MGILITQKIIKEILEIYMIGVVVISNLSDKSSTCWK